MAAMMMRSALARRLAGSAMKEIPSFRSAVPPATGRIPNLQGLQHFNVISRGTEGMKQANQMRYVSTGSNCGDAKLMELAWSAVKRWSDRISFAHFECVVIWTAAVSGWAVMARMLLFPKRGNLHVVNQARVAK